MQTHTYIYTHIYTYVKLFVICSEILPTQMPHNVGTSQLNRDKSQVTCFRKMRDTTGGNPRTESNNKSQEK